MNPLVNCPACGKRVAYDPASAGELWLCPACGAMMRLPPPAEITPPPPSEVPPPLPTETIPHHPPHWPVIVGLLAAVQAIIIILLVLPLHVTWEEQHRQEILDLKTRAEDLASACRPEEAYEKFRQLEQLVAGNPIHDPALKAAVQTAADEESKTFALAMKESAQEGFARGHPTATRPAAPPSTRRTVVVQAPPREETPPAPPPPPPAPARPMVHALPQIAASPVDDQQIGHTIQNGTQYLLDQFQLNKLHNASEYPDNDVDALAVYALLQAYNASGDTRLDPRRNFMKLVLDALKSLDINDHYATYGRALRANALALGGRREDKPQLEADLRWLLATGPQGVYTYPNQMIQRTGEMTNWVWDNSNSQYGLLGVWAAAEAGERVPRAYWLAAQKHWVSTQLPNGQWAYTAEDQNARQSMTLAGLASLLVTQDYLGRTPSPDSPGNMPTTMASVDPADAALQRGMEWLATGDNGVAPFDEGMIPGYTAYSLERVGLASGFKYFGSHDWYRESAANIINQARPDGSWGDPVQTSLALLFLARGRHPILINKLSFDGDWNDHPHDVASLARYAARALERQLNWQVVPLSHDWPDWSDCPILFLSASQPPTLTPEEEEKLRQFILNGGLLLTQDNGNQGNSTQGLGNSPVTQWVLDLGQRLFPKYQWAEPPADHPLWTVHGRVANPPHLLAIGNGARLFMVHLPSDVSHLWQTDGEGLPLVAAGPGETAATRRIETTDELSLGLNLFLYAVGRTDLHNRLVTIAISDTPDPAAAAIKLAQLSVAADSDPEPAAWPRFARWFRRQTDLGINLLVPTSLENLRPATAPIAHLTGVLGFHASDAQCAALKAYVAAGGVVLIDPCGGPNDFLRSVRDDLLKRAFPDTDMDRLTADHPLLTPSGDGMAQLWPLDVRDYVRGGMPGAGGQAVPIDRGLWILRWGKGCVIVSSLDITSGLLGTNTWGIAGFTPEYSMALAKNFVLWAWDGAKDQ